MTERARTGLSVAALVLSAMALGAWLRPAPSPWKELAEARAGQLEDLRAEYARFIENSLRGSQ